MQNRTAVGTRPSIFGLFPSTPPTCAARTPKPRVKSSIPWLLLGLVLFTLFAATALSAQVSGAIFTSTSTGTTVNGNLYDSKSDVYLNGGPQNTKDPGLVPDGTYYFQVTDPSGAVLLSKDDISCRQVVVTGGRIVGVPTTAPPATCVDGYHNLGTFNSANGEQPIELCNPNSSKCSTDFADTPNPGGEYKAWLTPVANYSPDPNPLHCSSKNANVVYGFCDSDSKTDNFKIKTPTAATVVVCKFNDENGNGAQDTGEPLIPFWPITATGVDTLAGPVGTVNAQTDANGCVSFSVSNFGTNPGAGGVVTLTEGFLAGNWQQTAPPDGTYTVPDGNSTTNGTVTVTVAGGVETFTLAAGDNVSALNFGNTCLDETCGGNTVELTVTKDANPSLTRTFTWGITKSVDQSKVFTAGGAPATFNYTVNVTHDSGTDSAWQVTGTIKVTNPSLVDVIGVTISDAVDNGGNCTLSVTNPITVPSKSEVDVPYVCTYSALPANGTNTATAAWDSNSKTGTASIDFTNPGIHAVDGSVNVTDTMGGSLGTVTSTDPSPTTFTYSKTFADPAGTCTSHNNTATFTTNTTGTTGSASQTVTDCQGADLIVSKTATASYNSNITKNVDKTRIEISGGSATFNYTVQVITSGWIVSGNITVANPNDWEDIVAIVSDSLSDSGGACTVTGGSGVTVTRSSFVTLPYTCTFNSVPTASSGTNGGIASWDASTYHTVDGSASGMAAYAFSILSVTDCFSAKGTTCTPNALGTVTIPPGLATFTYARTVPAPIGGTCQEYDNTATTQSSQGASQQVNVCNTKTGALTMGFWQNKNGQGIITGGTSTSGVCNSGSWVRQYTPFQDLSATATCSQTATYVYNLIKAANASGSSMNAMLKAQMLATALDVYFSDPTLGGNKISTPTPLGGVKIDLTQVCAMLDGSGGTATCSGSYENVSAAFGGATSLTVSQMLAYAASKSNVGGSVWYGNVKSTQALAKDVFDAINNQAAFIAP